jgi:FAD/FMN-containing dehydrogenase
MNRTYESWGRYPKVEHANVIPVNWRHNPLPLLNHSGKVLPYGLGRSYGDCCLNEGGVLLDTAGLTRYISFDEEQGILRCEAGVSLNDILELAVPRGWFLSVTPGTQFVTVGGAIANDVHGKNHHQAGTFGRYVPKFELLRSNGDRITCSPTQNMDLYHATIGGLGLTGLILWADIQLRRIAGPYIEMENVRFRNLNEFFELSAASDQAYEYIVSWVDCTAQGRNLGRGFLMRGNHHNGGTAHARTKGEQRRLSFPLEAPAFMLNRLTVRAFNVLYFRKQLRKYRKKVVHYKSFFYPLDAIKNWNRMYGRRGFFQYQCVVPYGNGQDTICEILKRIAASGNASFLAVLKTFGNLPSPGMLSFPRAGVTLALDFPNNGEKTLALLNDLDIIVRESKGALYPAKDARMLPETYATSFPNWQNFSSYIDPGFSSSLWRRVTSAQPEGVP